MDARHLSDQAAPVTTTAPPASAIPAWLQQHLTTRGLWDADGVARKVRARRCRRCGKLTLVGLDAPRCAGTATTDPRPLSALGEAAALILGLGTYALRFAAGHLELDRRGTFEIRGSPAGAVRVLTRYDRYDVVAEHRCDIVALPSLPTVWAAPRVPDYSGDPPY